MAQLFFASPHALAKTKDARWELSPRYTGNLSADLIEEQQRIGTRPALKAPTISEVQDANAGKLNPLSDRSYTHEFLLLRSRNYVTDNECVILLDLDELLNRHLCIREYFPETFVKLLHAFQSRFNPLISMQNDVLGIEVKIGLSFTWVGKTLERLSQALSVGHGSILTSSITIN